MRIITLNNQKGIKMGWASYEREKYQKERN
jgi:hypothetical protein